MRKAMKMEDVIYWFLSRQSMSPKKLQKMLYYAYSWGLVFFNESEEELDDILFEAEFEAWVHGPVIPSVYQEYKVYGFANIPKIEESRRLEIAEDVEDVLNQVMDAYGYLNGNQLEAITHVEDPWIKARKGALPLDSSSQKIESRTIYRYYCSQLGN